MVVFARKRAGALRKVRVSREKATDEEIERRMKDTAQSRSQKLRAKLGKDVKIAFGKKDIDAEVFQPVVGFQRECMKMIMEGDAAIVGALLEHKWYVKESKMDVTWKARLLEMGDELSVSYWDVNEEESDAVDWTIGVTDFLSDMILGDVQFQ